MCAPISCAYSRRLPENFPHARSTEPTSFSISEEVLPIVAPTCDIALSNDIPVFTDAAPKATTAAPAPATAFVASPARVPNPFFTAPPKPSALLFEVSSPLSYSDVSSVIFATKSRTLLIFFTFYFQSGFFDDFKCYFITGLFAFFLASCFEQVIIACFNR